MLRQSEIIMATSDGALMRISFLPERAARTLIALQNQMLQSNAMQAQYREHTIKFIKGEV